MAPDQRPLGWNDLRDLPLNLDIVREAYEQACKLHDDLLETKESFERRALALVELYITLAIAIFGASYIVLGQGQTLLACGLFIAGTIFTFGCISCLYALSGAKYGSRGSSPEIWITKRTLTGDEKEHALILAHVTTLIHDRIIASGKANKAKAAYLARAIAAGIAAPFLFGVVLLIGVVVSRS